MTRFTFYQSAKGGQGTTTTAVMHGVMAADRGDRVLLIDPTDTGDMARVAGVFTSEGVAVYVNEGIDMITMPVGELVVLMMAGGNDLTRRYDHVIVDVGTMTVPAMPNADQVVVVTECYLALSRTLPKINRYDRMVVIDDDSRALNPADVEATLGLPYTVVKRSADIARAVDAGLITVGRLNRYFTPLVTDHNEVVR